MFKGTDNPSPMYRANWQLKKWASTALCVCAALWSCASPAALALSSTRIIYPTNQRDVVVDVENAVDTPSLVQSWVDNGDLDAQPNAQDVAFLILPPLFRLEANGTKSLRIIYSGKALAQDRESVYWLNLLEVPQKATGAAPGDELKLAFRTRVKIFLRPPHLPGMADQSAAKLHWQLSPAGAESGATLTISNPSPYFVSLSEVDIKDAGQTFKNELAAMVPPKGTLQMHFNAIKSVTASALIQYQAINDIGGIVMGEAPLSH
ncbi:fimbrial biogenesis chaperone [Pseudomonas vancouverensis]|uniref:fimbrial biogenesis chaperone n=1 Tax=Pseudomonas vancouverensis TaxID=95300 RepID=UPI00087A66C3|nr:fimbria/pilus periplasmic chaperone [Pseudomonas vancouverensis]SDU99605.1 chaperone protein EcpD [Pseudomonas vancouverensis]